MALGGAAVPTGILSFGVATSGYRDEGGFDGPGEPHTTWSGSGARRRMERDGAAGTWGSPDTAIERAVAMGCDTFGLTVEWARLEPRPGDVDEAALDHYVALLESCAAHGLEPVVTLQHLALPWWQGEEFWLRPGSPDVFARHVARIASRLAPHCRRWVTLREANMALVAGWITGVLPPGRRLAFSDAFCVLDNLVTAHILAADTVAAARSDAAVTMSVRPSSVYELARMPLDLVQLRDAGVDPSDVDVYLDDRRAVHDAAFPPHHVGEAALRRLAAALSPYGTVHEPGRGPRWARLRGLTRRQAPRRVVTEVYAAHRSRGLDAVGIDWADPVASHALIAGGRRAASGQSTASDALLATWCATEAALRPGLPLWVTGTRSAQAVTAAQAAASGVPVDTYLQRSSVEAGAFTRVVAAGSHDGDPAAPRGTGRSVG